MKIQIEKTDRELHQRFIQLGNDRRKLTNELLAILPEIFQRKIYKKYAATIEEYAGKFGGLSKGVVQKRLRLEKHLENKPLLKAAIKTEGIHKVALVASLATPETETAWVDKLKNMSKPAIQELTKEVRYKNQNFNQSLFTDCKTNQCFAAPQHLKIDLEGELYFMFLKLKKKYGENLPAGQAGLSNQEVMKKIFEENLNSENQRKTERAENINDAKIHQPQSVKVIPGDSEASTRYVRVHIRRNLLQKTAGRCTYPGCQRPAQVLHHTYRFASSKFTKNPHESVVPICKIHHEFSHNGIIKNEKSEISEWQLQLNCDELDKIDQLYRKYRKVAG